MRSSTNAMLAPGPFRADGIRSKDPYELSNGHPVLCLPTGGGGSQKNRLGASVVGWDPSVKDAGVDTGFSPNPGTLRAPDVAVGNIPDEPGWVKGAPDLAIEYANVGQDEEKLAEKIDDLMKSGTKFLWVVRLVGPRRVEVYEAGKPMRTALSGELLRAKGVLKNAVKVDALYDRDEAERATLTNLLQRQGFADLDEVLRRGREAGHVEGRVEGLEEGHKEGHKEGERAASANAIVAVLDARGLKVTKAIEKRVMACKDTSELTRWLRRAAVVARANEIFD